MLSKKEVLENLDKVKEYISEIESDKIKEKKRVNLVIKNRFTGEIIWESEKTTYKEAIEEAIASRANLSEADLSWADLSKADLSEANLSWANLSKANLSEANLSWANLNGTLYYMGNGNRNFEALCKAIKTIRHQDGKFDDLVK